ncbi:putative beta-lysine N-acetyltransferase [Tichowtungia aerotolerans]|uniref:Putative beta-lysine N-acetyltransferase n=1 Tax=Tichowtungia aerotolerans TaxID=2697043 RepID=A0A6P1M7F4_9BACT|nr:putative beta-lysine N-acetyltransferase [Tichowtungia aerotolerans]QHI68108.1 putative beta-lysine N-acetyltransferase [Tichowtungia aerotolerans]
MHDTIEKLGNSQIQHGPDNNRIYLMKLDPADMPGIIGQLNELAAEKGYTKIFAKVPGPSASAFVREGYCREGMIPHFYSGKTTATFLGKFIDPMREATRQRNKIENIIILAQSKNGTQPKPLPEGYTMRPAVEADAEELAAVYKQVFESYPFPIHDPDYLIKTMRSHVCYFVAEKDGKIAAAASGEMDKENRNAEMTDFATLPEHLGNGLAVHLLKFMEPEMQKRGIATLYTIARAISPGMNITFSKCGYTFGGTLINNTQISGSIESMNLWHKSF